MIKNNNLVSIIMPAYNSENTIKDSVKSVIHQTYTNWELIIIDDSSKDSTLKYMHAFEKKDSRIKIYANDKNLGVSRTRNRAISKSKGDWIAFLDSDDIWKHDKLEKQISFIKQKNAKFVYTDSVYINENNERYPSKYEVPSVITYKKLRKQNVISTSSVIVQKNLIENRKFGSDRIHEDFAMWLDILKNEKISGYGLSERLLIYRLYKDSKSGNKIKSFSMTYGVFRSLNLNTIQSLYYTLNHLFRSLYKYKKILRG